MMKFSRFFVTGMALALAACTVTVDEGQRPITRPDPRSGICPRIFDPVCATRFGERETFSNACVAESRGFDIVYDGECRRRPIIEPPISPRPRPLPDDEAVVCPAISAPVCARDGRVLRTFRNACIAQGSGFSVIDDGPC